MVDDLAEDCFHLGPSKVDSRRLNGFKHEHNETMRGSPEVVIVGDNALHLRGGLERSCILLYPGEILGLLSHRIIDGVHVLDLRRGRSTGDRNE